MGTGTGILAFVLTKICKKKVIATDIDLESEISITTNKRLNYENNIFFLRCNSFSSKYLNNKKFDLVVSNMLLKPLKINTAKFCYHLINGGFVIISGILRTQVNDILTLYCKFNLKLVKSIYINNWASMILKKK